MGVFQTRRRAKWLNPNRRKWIPFKPALTHDKKSRDGGANDNREKPVFEGPFAAQELVEQGMNYRTGVLTREKCFRTAEKFLAILVRKKSCPFALRYYNFPVLPPSKLL